MLCLNKDLVVMLYWKISAMRESRPEISWPTSLKAVWIKRVWWIDHLSKVFLLYFRKYESDFCWKEICESERPDNSHFRLGKIHFKQFLQIWMTATLRRWRGHPPITFNNMVRYQYVYGTYFRKFFVTNMKRGGGMKLKFLC